MFRTQTIAALAVLLVLGCEANDLDRARLVDGRPEWQKTAWRFMVNDDCAGALRYLKEHEMPQEAMWYVLRSQADLLCWQNKQGDGYRADALQTLDDGLRALPSSPRLLKAKAEAFVLLHDPQQAQYYFSEARRSAETDLAARKENTREDQEVLNELHLSGH